MACRLILAREVVRQIAVKQHRLHASFLPKLKEEWAGSGSMCTSVSGRTTSTSSEEVVGDLSAKSPPPLAPETRESARETHEHAHETHESLVKLMNFLKFMSFTCSAQQIVSFLPPINCASLGRLLPHKDVYSFTKVSISEGEDERRERERERERQGRCTAWSG